MDYTQPISLLNAARGRFSALSHRRNALRDQASLTPGEGKPQLSIIVIVFNMTREAPRTLHSLTPGYQRGVAAGEYEVIVVENGSTSPLAEEVVREFGTNFRYFRMLPSSPSPARAINFGASMARGSYLAVMIDGARLLTPGVVRAALLAIRAHQPGSCLVATLGWHLGPELQGRSVQSGYGHAAEDRLLAQIDWPQDGYRLFEVATLAGSSDRGWFQPISESNCLVVSSDVFGQLGGYDERFDAPGGGLVNLDFFARACTEPGVALVVLLGEGTFHQFHGGVATSQPPERFAELWDRWAEQYRQLRGRAWLVPRQAPSYLGTVPRAALRWLRESTDIALRD
jgi:glycosyltransferase involved in cell wall biosynthesis